MNWNYKSFRIVKNNQFFYFYSELIADFFGVSFIGQGYFNYNYYESHQFYIGGFILIFIQFNRLGAYQRLSIQLNIRPR